MKQYEVNALIAKALKRVAGVINDTENRPITTMALVDALEGVARSMQDEVKEALAHDEALESLQKDK